MQSQCPEARFNKVGEKIIFASLFSSPILVNVDRAFSYRFTNFLTTFTYVFPILANIACDTDLNK